jgi:hypothetical protein
MPCGCEVRSNCIGKELPVIPVNRVADRKIEYLEKMEGLGGGKAQGVADPPERNLFTYIKLVLPLLIDRRLIGPRLID